MVRKNLFVTIAACTGLMLVAAPGAAESLMPNSHVTTSGSTYPTTGATLVASETVPAFGFPNATVKEEVFRATGTGTLDFLFQLTNVSTGVISTFGVGNYSGFSTNVDYATNSTAAGNPIPGFVNPGTVSTTGASRSIGGSIVTFEFSPSGLTPGGLTPGATSDVLYIETNATSYDVGGAGLENGAVSGVGVVGHLFEPTVAPEPSSIALAGVGGLCLGLLSWRRFARSRLV